MSSSSLDTVMAVARLLEEHKAEHTVVLDVAQVCGWTDYFVISTPRSATHMRALLERLWELLDERQVGRLNGGRGAGRAAAAAESGWILVDCGSFIVHLMDQERRDFYELEKLWFAAEEVYSSSSNSSLSSSES